MGTIENKFNEDMKNIYFTAKMDIGYTATRFMKLVSQKGGYQAAKQLIAKEGGTYGFEVLWENKRLEERILCKDRLKEFGYDTVTKYDD